MKVKALIKYPYLHILTYNYVPHYNMFQINF